MADLPSALADLPIERIEELERETGEGFGKLVAEISEGNWSVATMRRLLVLLDPDRPIETMGDLMAAAEEILGKVPKGTPL
jgi:hypothetical protein